MHTDFVQDALERALCEALCERNYAQQSEREGALIHHSDRGSRYASIRYSERQQRSGSGASG